MKKILTILAACGFTTSLSTTVVSCSFGQDKNNTKVKNIYHNFKKPQSESEALNLAADLKQQANNLSGEIVQGELAEFDAVGEEDFDTLQKDVTNPKTQEYFALGALVTYTNGLAAIYSNDLPAAIKTSQFLNNMLQDQTFEQEQYSVTFKPSQTNCEEIKKLIMDLDQEIIKNMPIKNPIEAPNDESNSYDAVCEI